MSKLTHIDETGRARMVDVSDKAATTREAVAQGFLRMSAQTLALALSGEGAKGDVMLQAGSAVEGWHAVLSGLVMLRSPASGGRASAFIGVSDGDWFGEGSAMKPEPRRYDVVALRPTCMLCLPLPLFATLRETSLAFNQFLVLHMNMRLGQAMAIIEAGRMRSTEHRVALYLSRLFWRSTRPG